MSTADVTVRGAGVLGLAVAWACAARGARVRVIDPAGIGAGASGGLVGALSPFAPERWDEAKAAQLDSLLMAEEFWAEVHRAGGVDPGYARTGRLMPLADEAAIAGAQARGEAARTLWRGRAAWEVVPAAGLPFAPLSPTGLLARDTLAARLDPRRALAALAAAIAAQGREVARAGPDEGVVVDATGVAGLRATGRGDGVKGQAARLLLAAPGAPQVYAGGLYVVPHADGTVAVGSTSERSWADPTATDAQLDALVARARALVPALQGAPVTERWAALRPRAASGALLLGPDPSRPGVLLANGGFRTGFGLAPLAARLLADLILDGRDAIPTIWRATP